LHGKKRVIHHYFSKHTPIFFSDVFRKCVVGCEIKLTLFSFPKDPTVLNQPMQFVFPWPATQSLHFTDNCFMNKIQCGTGRLKLKLVEAVPILNKHESEL